MKKLMLLFLVLALLPGCKTAGTVNQFFTVLDTSEVVYSQQAVQVHSVLSSYDKIYSIGKASYDTKTPITKEQAAEISELTIAVKSVLASLSEASKQLEKMWDGMPLNQGRVVYRAQKHVMLLIIESHEAIMEIGTKAYDEKRAISEADYLGIRLHQEKIKQLRRGLEASYDKLKDIWAALYVQQRKDIDKTLQLGQMAIAILQSVIK